MIVGGKRDVFIFEARLQLLGHPTLSTSEVFVVCISRKSSLNEGLECGCLSHATMLPLELSLWIVLIYA